MEINEVKNKNQWEGFLLKCQEKTFLSSWSWGEFQKATGNKIWRLGIFENNELISIALVIKIAAKRGSFLFLPHCPVVKDRGKQFFVISNLLEKLKKIAREEKCSFVRIAPVWQRTKENVRIFQDLNFRQAPIHIHPELTWELDITLPEKELLMNMRKTTRYLIRQAEKNKDIKITQSNNIEDVEKFNKLYQATVNRHHFVPFSLDYLKNEFSAFQADEQTASGISIFLGKYKDKIIASAIIIFWQGTGFYHQGASSLEYPKVPVSYLLQWEAIKEAKKRGCKLYNFWGIAPLRLVNNHLLIINKNHPWYGLTLFKMGFGGRAFQYVKTKDFPLSKKYWLTYLFEKLRKTKRGL